MRESKANQTEEGIYNIQLSNILKRTSFLRLSEFNSFLGVNVSVINGKIITKPYTKPTDNHQYLLHSSSHRIHTKRAIPFSLAARLRLQPTFPPTRNHTRKEHHMKRKKVLPP